MKRYRIWGEEFNCEDDTRGEWVRYEDVWELADIAGELARELEGLLPNITSATRKINLRELIRQAYEALGEADETAE